MFRTGGRGERIIPEPLIYSSASWSDVPVRGERGPWSPPTIPPVPINHPIWRSLEVLLQQPKFMVNFACTFPQFYHAHMHAYIQSNVSLEGYRVQISYIEVGKMVQFIIGQYHRYLTHG